MTRFVHDQFAQEYLPQLFNDYGTVVSAANVTAEIRQVDVLFTPTKPVPTTPETLGLLGKLAQQTCLFEIFRNAVQTEEIESCASKLLDYRIQQRRVVKREKIELESQNLHKLWIITPTFSKRILDLFGGQESEEFGKGIYLSSPIWNTGIVVVHQLPVNLSTLWLRILGRDKVQETAIRELKSLSNDHFYRNDILELIYNLLSIIEANRQKGEILDKEDEEFMVKLSPIYLEQLEAKREEGKLEGREEGIITNLRDNIISILSKRFQTLPSELVSQINSLEDKVKLQQLHLETISVNSISEFQTLIDD
jgi:hypothetical protein